MANKKDIEKILQNAKKFVFWRDNSESIVDSLFVKKLRKKLSMSQVVFAEAIGVKKKTVEMWEQNRNPISGTSAKLLYLLDLRPELIQDFYTYKIVTNDKISAFQPKPAYDLGITANDYETILESITDSIHDVLRTKVNLTTKIDRNNIVSNINSVFEDKIARPNTQFTMCIESVPPTNIRVA